MRFRAQCLLTFLTAMFCLSSVSAQTEKLTGREWLKITEQRKLYYVFGMREKYQEEGTIFSKPAGDYPELIDGVIRRRSELLDKSVDEAFDAVVRETESRPSSSRKI